MKVLLIGPTALDYTGKPIKQKKLHLPGLTLPMLTTVTPADVQLRLLSATVEETPFDEHWDLVRITGMSSGIVRAWQIADEFRKRKTKVVIGGFIAASEEVIVYLKHGSATYMFSAALSPANCAASCEALKIIPEEKSRLKRLWRNTRQMLIGLQKAGIDTGQSQSPVIPVICGENEKALTLSKALFKKGFLANAVVYPAVPFTKARLRLCCTAAHEAVIIQQFIEAVTELYNQ